MMSVFIPVMFIAVGALMLFALYLMAMRSGDAGDHRQRLQHRLLSTSVFIVFFCQPTAVKEALALFTCVDVDGKSLLYAAVEIDCKSTSHISWFVVAAASLFVFVAGLPLLVFWRMYNVRDAIVALEEQAVRQWGFLTNNLVGHTHTHTRVATRDGPDTRAMVPAPILDVNHIALCCEAKVLLLVRFGGLGLRALQRQGWVGYACDSE